MSAPTMERRVDFDDVVGKLAAGNWIAYPYEAYGQLDRAEWNDQMVKYLAERDIHADVIDVPKKSVAVLINIDWPPSFEQVTDSIAAIDHQRAVGH